MKPSFVNINNMKKLFWKLAIFFSFYNNAWACIKADDSIDIPIYVYPLIISIIFALLIIGITYLVKRIFFKTTNFYSVGIVAILVFAFIIGLLGSFILPIYQDMFDQMGMALAIQTEVLFKYKHVLWAPLFIAAVVVWRSNNNKIKLSWVLSFIGFEIVLLTMVFWSLYSSVIILGCV